jgi:hypothetical protein
VDTVAQWEASRALKGAVDALLADLLRGIGATGRPEDVALTFGARLERLMQESGLPLGVATKAGFGGKSIDDLLEGLEAAGFPPDGLAEIRAAMGKSAARTSPAARDRAAALALVPAIPLPEHFEDPTAALARVPAISLPEHLDDPGEPRAAVDAEQTEQATVAAEAAARASEGAPHVDEPGEATMRRVARSAAVIGITLADDDLRIAARFVDHFRVRAEGLNHRAAQFRGPIQRRPRASRAPRRAAHRNAVAPARDGPPPSDDAPAPVASRSPRGAIGGSR